MRLCRLVREDLAGQVSHALARVVEEPADFGKLHTSVEPRLDIPVFLYGERDLECPVIVRHEVQKIIDVCLVLPCEQQVFVVVLDDAHPEGLPGDALELQLYVLYLCAADEVWHAFSRPYREAEAGF